MANPEHLQILQQGVEAWNQWRDQYRDIRPYLGRADLSGANLREANLYRANLFGATLYEADLSRANLTGANLSEVGLLGTVFGYTNLTDVRGLDTCHHEGPSTLDHRTLAQSRTLPLAFLRGCGLSDWEIEATKLYQPGLTPTQINDIVYRIYSLCADPLIQFYSCFISYASKDQLFAERLYADLQNKGVRCWFAPKDLPIGAKILVSIDESIRLYDKLLLVLSKSSVKSQWVEGEVATALAQERQQGTTILFPVRIDNTVMTLETGWPALIRNTRNIGDFRRWKTHSVYQQAFDRLLRDLKAADRQP
jgi:TIR domain/Pentapeptide repeats (8 copies)